MIINLKYFIIRAIMIFFFLNSCSTSNSKISTWEGSMKQISTHNKIKLNHEEYGSGDPILFIHGFGSNTFSWRYLIHTDLAP